MLDEYVEDLKRRLTHRAEAETAKLVAGTDNVDLIRGRAQAYGQALRDADDVLEAHTKPDIAPDHLSEEPERNSYGRMHRRVS
jgi:hypothetical protein